MLANTSRLALAVALLAGALLLGSGLRADPSAEDRGDKKAAPDDPTRAALRRLQSKRKLQQIGLALHNYADTFGKLPAPATYDKDGKPLLSWRVALLPFLEEDNLWKQFKTDEPWDGPTNKKLLAEMPAAYAAPGVTGQDADKTYYQAIVGQGAAWEPRKEMRFPASFADGTSNTILVVEAATPVPWTKPEDLPYVADQALPKFGGLFDGNFNALFADGVVQFLSGKADQENLRAAITPAAGDVIDFDKLLVAGSRGPSGKVDVKDLPRQNERLKEAINGLLKELEQEKEEIDLLKAKITAGTPKIDAKTAKLLKDNAELQKTLNRALDELDALQAQRARLEKELRQPSKKEEKKQ